MNEFETEDGHLNLENACHEIVWLYEVYGLETDDKLTGDAIELKKKIRAIVETIRNLP